MLVIWIFSTESAAYYFIHISNVSEFELAPMNITDMIQITVLRKAVTTPNYVLQNQNKLITSKIHKENIKSKFIFSMNIFFFNLFKHFHIKPLFIQNLKVSEYVRANHGSLTSKLMF